MSKYIHQFLSKNVDNFQLQMADLRQSFNSCSMLLYHTLLDVKKESSMGWHCDGKYSLSGKFKKNSNGQGYNTVVAIFTIGSDGFVQWRMRMTKKNEKGRTCYTINSDFQLQALLESGSIFILNPRDEMPHDLNGSKYKVHYQHGNVRITKEQTSVAFVFRVSPHACTCNATTNAVVLDEATKEKIRLKELNGHINMEQRQMQYDKLDVKSYHNKMIAKFKDVMTFH